MDKGKVTELVVKAQAGDSRAMEELLRLAHTSVSYQCRKYMSNAEDAEDMTQEALIKIYKNIGSLQEPEKFLGWASRIAARQCIDALRRDPKDVQFSEDEDGHSALDDLEELDEQRVPDAALDNAETTRMIQEIIDGLPEAQRTSAYLYYYSQMSVAEIAEMMGVSENTVKSRLNYARKAIKESVEEYEKKDGIKLYGMSPLPFLLFFLQKSAEGSANLAAADIMAKAAIAAEGAAIAGAAAVTFSQPADEPEPTTYIEESYEPPSFEPTPTPTPEPTPTPVPIATYTSELHYGTYNDVPGWYFQILIFEGVTEGYVKINATLYDLYQTFLVGLPREHDPEKHDRNIIYISKTFFDHGLPDGSCYNEFYSVESQEDGIVTIRLDYEWDLGGIVAEGSGTFKFDALTGELIDPANLEEVEAEIAEAEALIADGTLEYGKDVFIL